MQGWGRDGERGEIQRTERRGVGVWGLTDFGEWRVIGPLEDLPQGMMSKTSPLADIPCLQPPRFLQVGERSSPGW